MATSEQRVPGGSVPVWTDPREEIGYTVLLPNGRLAGRSFADEAAARAWAREDEGEQVVAINPLCDCEM